MSGDSRMGKCFQQEKLHTYSLWEDEPPFPVDYRVYTLLAATEPLMSDNEKQRQSWWSTFPGLVTAIAGLITAVGGLFIALHTAGVLKSQNVSSSSSIVRGTDNSGNKENDDNRKVASDNKTSEGHEAQTQDNNENKGPVEIAHEPVYGSFKLDKYGYSFLYPKDLLFPAGNYDGWHQSFKSADGMATMTVSINESSERFTVAKEAVDMANMMEGRGYKILKEDVQQNFFAISYKYGTKSGYFKTVFASKVFRVFTMEYDESVRDVYDKVVAKLSPSFED